MRLICVLLLASSIPAVAAQPQPGPQPRPQAGPQPGGGPVMVPMRRMRQPTPPPAFQGDHARLPMTLVDGVPVVSVMVGGRPFRFALDTGAVGHGRIRPAVAEALGLAEGETMRSGDGSGAVQERRSFTGANLSFGEVRFSGVALSEMANIPGRFEGVDGILGRDLFASHLLAIDYAAGNVSLSRGALPESAARSEMTPRGITVPLRLGDETVTAVIDTGNAVAPLIVPAVLAERLRSGAPRPAGRARTAMSAVEMFEADLAQSVTLGATRLPVSRFRYPALGDVANLGSQAFAGGTLVVDQANRRIAYLPAAPTERARRR